MTTQPEALRLAADLKLIGAESSLTRHQAAHELLRLHQHELANEKWHDKTSWVRTTKATTEELGMHRADAIKQRYDRLQALNQELANELKKLAADAESNIRSEYEGTTELSKKLKSLAPARAAIAKATGEVHG